MNTILENMSMGNLKNVSREHMKTPDIAVFVVRLENLHAMLVRLK